MIEFKCDRCDKSNIEHDKVNVLDTTKYKDYTPNGSFIKDDFVYQRFHLCEECYVKYLDFIYKHDKMEEHNGNN